ncbi:hypothetical protein [Streptococcus pneumoniae]|uniref:hypothetical protein n=1 Tax=Streptococcus pneumoniae TaxID=1313 RepID=UPI0007104727|nr:hypothetical protein [Streptococcus pneumoniae]
MKQVKNNFLTLNKIKNLLNLVDFCCPSIIFGSFYLTNLNTIVVSNMINKVILYSLKRNKRSEKLKSELEDSISIFNQATENTRVKYINVANSYLKKLNTDNQQQDFKQALDTKFKAIDNQTNQF